MKLVGLTGGVGMGKSASVSLLRSRGIEVIDTDDLARQIVEPGQPAVARIRESFGDGVIAADGRLHRRELARLVFGDPAAREKLEGILHPVIRALWQEQAATWRAEERVLGVVVIPLLFETAAESAFDTVICVACSSATQRQRLSERGWSAMEIGQRIGSQLPVDTKISRSNYVIWTEGDLALHAAQLDRILSDITRA